VLNAFFTIDLGHGGMIHKLERQDRLTRISTRSYEVAYPEFSSLFGAYKSRS
jgi:hypothetical protein